MGRKWEGKERKKEEEQQQQQQNEGQEGKNTGSQAAKVNF